MTLHVKDTGAVIQEITDLQVRDSVGTLRAIKQGWVRDSGGVLRQFYSNLEVAMANTTADGLVFSPTDAAAGIRIDNDGGVYVRTAIGGGYSFNHTWLIRGTAGEIWCEYSINSESGDAFSTDSFGGPGNRFSCASDLTLEGIETGLGTNFKNITYSFYDAATGGNLLDTATGVIDFSVEV